MREIRIKENKTELKVYINGVPDLKQIPKETAGAIIYALAVKSEEYAQKSRKRCKGDKKREVIKKYNKLSKGRSKYY